MRPTRAIGMAAFGAAVAAAGTASAEQPRDYFLNPPPPGTYANLDVYTVGIQASLEDRRDLEEGMSMAYNRVSGVVGLPYGDASYNLDARVFLFTLGGSVGYRHVWKNHTFAFGDPDTGRKKRVQRESDLLTDETGFPYGEGRLRLTIPLDSFFMVNTATVRWEDQRDNTFDWYHGNIHDGGTYWKYDGVLFYRHRDFGAIGPTVRYMSYEREGLSKSDFTYGFTFGSRPGWKRGSDLFLFQMLFNFGDDDYGLHGYRIDAPFTVLAVYRAVVPL